MRNTILLAITASLSTVLTLAGCGAIARRSTTVESGGEVAPAVVTPVNNRTIPVGTDFVATLDQTLGTRVSKAGDVFTATVSNTLYAQDGSIVVPIGEVVCVKLLGATRSIPLTLREKTWLPTLPS